MAVTHTSVSTNGTGVLNVAGVLFAVSSKKLQKAASSESMTDFWAALGTSEEQTTTTPSHTPDSLDDHDDDPTTKRPHSTEENDVKKTKSLVKEDSEDFWTDILPSETGKKQAALRRNESDQSIDFWSSVAGENEPEKEPRLTRNDSEKSVDFWSVLATDEAEARDAAKPELKRGDAVDYWADLGDEESGNRPKNPSIEISDEKPGSLQRDDSLDFWGDLGGEKEASPAIKKVESEPDFMSALGFDREASPPPPAEVMRLRDFDNDDEAPSRSASPYARSGRPARPMTLPLGASQSGNDALAQDEASGGMRRSPSATSGHTDAKQEADGLQRSPQSPTTMPVPKRRMSLVNKQPTSGETEGEPKHRPSPLSFLPRSDSLDVDMAGEPLATTPRSPRSFDKASLPPIMRRSPSPLPKRTGTPRGSIDSGTPGTPPEKARSPSLGRGGPRFFAPDSVFPGSSKEKSPITTPTSPDRAVAADLKSPMRTVSYLQPESRKDSTPSSPTATTPISFLRQDSTEAKNGPKSPSPYAYLRSPSVEKPISFLRQESFSDVSPSKKVEAPITPISFLKQTDSSETSQVAKAPAATSPAPSSKPISFLREDSSKPTPQPAKSLVIAAEKPISFLKAEATKAPETATTKEATSPVKPLSFLSRNTDGSPEASVAIVPRSPVAKSPSSQAPDWSSATPTPRSPFDRSRPPIIVEPSSPVATVEIKPRAGPGEATLRTRASSVQSRGEARAPATTTTATETTKTAPAAPGTVRQRSQSQNRGDEAETQTARRRRTRQEEVSGGGHGSIPVAVSAKERFLSKVQQAAVAPPSYAAIPAPVPPAEDELGGRRRSSALSVEPPGRRRSSGLSSDSMTDEQAAEHAAKIAASQEAARLRNIEREKRELEEKARKKQLEEERLLKLEQERLQRAEQEKLRREEAIRRRDEEKARDEKRREEEQARKAVEELARKEQERTRAADEQKREARRQLDMEKRMREEDEKAAAEKLRKEKEAAKKAADEENRQRLTKLEEKARAEEERRRKETEERQAENRKKQTEREARQKEQEEKRRKELEEIKAREDAERQRLLVEKQRIEEQKRQFAEEERKRADERRKREEEERKRKEEERQRRKEQELAKYEQKFAKLGEHKKEIDETLQRNAASLQENERRKQELAGLKASERAEIERIHRQTEEEKLRLHAEKKNKPKNEDPSTALPARRQPTKSLELSPEPARPPRDKAPSLKDKWEQKVSQETPAPAVQKVFTPPQQPPKAAAQEKPDLSSLAKVTLPVIKFPVPEERSPSRGREDTVTPQVKNVNIVRAPPKTEPQTPAGYGAKPAAAPGQTGVQTPQQSGSTRKAEQCYPEPEIPTEKPPPPRNDGKIVRPRGSFIGGVIDIDDLLGSSNKNFLSAARTRSQERGGSRDSSQTRAEDGRPSGGRGGAAPAQRPHDLPKPAGPSSRGRQTEPRQTGQQEVLSPTVPCVVLERKDYLRKRIWHQIQRCSAPNVDAFLSLPALPDPMTGSGQTYYDVFGFPSKAQYCKKHSRVSENNLSVLFTMTSMINNNQSIKGSLRYERLLFTMTSMINQSRAH